MVEECAKEVERSDTARKKRGRHVRNANVVAAQVMLGDSFFDRERTCDGIGLTTNIAFAEQKEAGREGVMCVRARCGMPACNVRPFLSLLESPFRPCEERTLSR